MATLGVMNDLKVLRLTPEGAVLDGGEEGEVLLPLQDLPKPCEPDQVLKVFVTVDPDGQLRATPQRPLALRGEVAFLKIVSTNKEGAFLAWGLPKDLFLPWNEVRKEQQPLIQPGQRAMVILFKDEGGQIIASTRLEEFLTDEAEGFQEGNKVHLIVGDTTDLGVRVAVNHRYWGMVHHSDIFGPLTRGEARTGYIKALRADQKLNIALNAPGYAKVDAVSQKVLNVLKAEGGFMNVSDKSQPEEIYARFGVSKKAFKLALGALYKARRIVIEAEGIRLVP